MKIIDVDKLLYFLANEDLPQEAHAAVLDGIEQGLFDPDNVPGIKVGDRVTHEKHSSGVVTTISISGEAYVKWDKPILTGSVRVTDLELLKDTNNGGK